MSKMDELRALREARYKQEAASGAKPAAPKATRQGATSKPSGASRPAEKVAAAAASSDALCGHRSISGRTCTREQGHSAKSHRYS